MFEIETNQSTAPTQQPDTDKHAARARRLLTTALILLFAAPPLWWAGETLAAIRIRSGAATPMSAFVRGGATPNHSPVQATTNRQCRLMPSL